MGRWIRFFIAMAIGAAAAMYYGWKINPVHYTVTTPDTLRIDFKADYVLMVAEAFRTEADLDLAARRLTLISDNAPIDMVNQAIQYAENLTNENAYPPADLTLMRDLAAALESWNPVPGKPAP
jgi:hypothetical protein